MPEVRREGHAALHGSSTADILASTYQGAGALGAQIREMTKGVTDAVGGVAGAGVPEQTRYEMRLAGAGRSVSGTLTLPEGHLWDVRVLAYASTTVTVSAIAGGGPRVAATTLTARVIEPDGVEVREVVYDWRSYVTTHTVGTRNANIAGAFSGVAFGSPEVVLSCTPINDPDITYTADAEGTTWTASADDLTPGALIVATWLRALGVDEAT